MAPTVPTRGGPQGRHPPGLRFPFNGGKSIPGATGGKRHRKIKKDTIRGITKPDIRRLARRGGVRRISGGVYDDVRQALDARLRSILEKCVIYTEYRNAKTITINDVLFSLRALGQPIYGFDPDTYEYGKSKTQFPSVHGVQLRR